MKKKKKDKRPGFRMIYDPYCFNENDGFDDKLRRYIDDPDKSYRLGDLTFYKAFQIFDIFVGKHLLTLGMSTELYLRLGDVLIDNNSNEYKVTEFQMIRLCTSIPEWYTKLYFCTIIGPEDNIGQFFAKWSERASGEQNP